MAYTRATNSTGDASRTRWRINSVRCVSSAENGGNSRKQSYGFPASNERVIKKISWIGAPVAATSCRCANSENEKKKRKKKKEKRRKERGGDRKREPYDRGYDFLRVPLYYREGFDGAYIFHETISSAVMRRHYLTPYRVASSTYVHTLTREITSNQDESSFTRFGNRARHTVEHV